MKKIKLADHADAIILTALLVVLFAAMFCGIGWLESAIGVLLAFVMPGWLFVRLLFGERPFELEVEVLLILFISAFLIGLEVLVLIYFRIPVSKSLLQFLSVATDGVLLVILKIRQARQMHMANAPRRINWPSLVAAVIVPLVLLAFGLFHIHETRESFTEFYEAAGSFADGSLTLMVESHEERTQFFTLVCQTEVNERRILGNFELSPGEQQQISIAYSHNAEQDEKLRLALDQHKGVEGYRWIEIPGRHCEDLTAEFE
jgi:hypothetical protein